MTGSPVNTPFSTVVRRYLEVKGEIDVSKQKNTQNNQLLQVVTRIDSLNRGHVFSHEKVTYRSKQGHSEERGISCGIYSFHIRCYFQSGNFGQGSPRNLTKDATSEHKPCVATLIRYG